MKKRTGIITVAILAPLLAFSGHLMAKDHAQKACHKDPGAKFSETLFSRAQKVEHMAEKLNLDDQQKTRIRSLVEAKRTTHKDLMNQLRDSRQQVKRLRTGEVDLEKMRALAKQHADLQARLMVFNYELHNAVMNELTEQQKAEITQHREMKKQRREQRLQERLERHRQES